METKEALKVEVIKQLGPKLMQYTLKQCQEMGVEFKMFQIKGGALDMPWDIVIKTCNFSAGRTVLRWTNTLEEAIEMIGIFLM